MTAVLGSSLRLNPLMRWYTAAPADGRRPNCVMPCRSRATWLACARLMVAKFGGKHSQRTFDRTSRRCFGFTDCPIVEGDQLICTPGGPDAAVVALDKFTGLSPLEIRNSDAGKVTFGNGSDRDYR